PNWWRPLRTWLRPYGSAYVFLWRRPINLPARLLHAAPQSRSHSSPHKSTLALDVPQQVIARIGLRPFVGIGTIDALGEVAADAEIDGHVDHPGTPAGKGPFERRRRRSGIIDANAFRAVGVGQRDVVGIVRLARIFAHEMTPRMAARVAPLHALALDSKLVIFEDDPDRRQIVFHARGDDLRRHVECAIADQCDPGSAVGH